jgi:hypothetical protein
MNYFAYGSNMSFDRLTAQDRLPSAKVKTIGHITGYVFKFNKISIDGSGKGNIEHTGNPNNMVYGVVYEFDKSEKSKLDNAEKGYDEITVTVSTPKGEIKAYAYYSTNTDNTLKPTASYKKYVVDGAKENGLPKDYIKKLRRFTLFKRGTNGNTLIRP